MAVHGDKAQKDADKNEHENYYYAFRTVLTISNNFYVREISMKSFEFKESFHSLNVR